jgi:hypothetical protein
MEFLEERSSLFVWIVFFFGKRSKGLFTVVTKGRDQSFSCIVIGGKLEPVQVHFTLLRMTKVAVACD